MKGKKRKGKGRRNLDQEALTSGAVCDKINEKILWAESMHKVSIKSGKAGKSILDVSKGSFSAGCRKSSGKFGTHTILWVLAIIKIIMLVFQYWYGHSYLGWLLWNNSQYIHTNLSSLLLFFSVMGVWKEKKACNLIKTVNTLLLKLKVLPTYSHVKNRGYVASGLS